VAGGGKGQTGGEMAVSWRSVWPKAMGRLRPNASGQRKAAWTEWLSKPSIVDARGGLERGGKEEEAERVGNGGRWSRARRAVKGTGAGLGSGRRRAAAFGCTSRVGPARRAWDRRRQSRETLPFESSMKPRLRRECQRGSEKSAASLAWTLDSTCWATVSAPRDSLPSWRTRCVFTCRS